MCSSKQNKMLLLLPVSSFFPLKIIVRWFFGFVTNHLWRETLDQNFYDGFLFFVLGLKCC